MHRFPVAAVACSLPEMGIGLSRSFDASVGIFVTPIRRVQDNWQVRARGCNPLPQLPLGLRDMCLHAHARPAPTACNPGRQKVIRCSEPVTDCPAAPFCITRHASPESLTSPCTLTPQRAVNLEVKALDKKVADKLEQFHSEVKGTVKQNIKVIKHTVDCVLQSFNQALMQATVRSQRPPAPPGVPRHSLMAAGLSSPAAHVYTV